MKDNGKVIEGKILTAEEKPEVLEPTDDEKEKDGILNADWEIPIRPNPKFVYQQKRNPGYNYYQKIQEFFQEWWEDWNTSIDEKGQLKYKTINQFINEKTKNKLEREYLWEMIGPRPVLIEGRQLRVPWLGDWYLRRQNGFWAPDNPGKMKSLMDAMKKQMVSWDAVRSAAPFIAQEMAKAMKMGEQVDEAFAGMALLPGPLDEQNISRYKLYIMMKKDVLEMKERLLSSWMKIHGVDPENPVYQVQINAMAAQFNNPLGIMQDAGQLPKEKAAIETVRLAKQLMAHAENFKMPLPEKYQPPEQKPPEQPTNGKVVKEGKPN